MAPRPHPCRLSVYLASKARVALVLRRGPSDWAQLTLWDRATDQFEPGQWFHGRVYERRCDLSPDGALFVYFAAKHGRTHDPDEVGEAWTAISRPPYFTALTLWDNLGSWYGGGVFASRSKVLLDVTCSLEQHPKFKPAKVRLDRVPADSAPWEQRALRDGWQLAERGFDPRTHRRVGKREIWQKPHAGAPITLGREVEDVDFESYGGPYRESYWLETADDIVPLPGVTWADWDGAERLVLVRDGVVLEARWTSTGLAEADLFDFNPLGPAEVPTPAWATHW